MNADAQAALTAAKIRRADAGTAAAEAAIRAKADCADLEVCSAQVVKLAQRRVAAIAAAKPDRVVAVDGELLRAKVGAEIAEARAAKSAERRDAAVVALHDAEAGVAAAAQSALDAEPIALAGAFPAALDAALEIGAKLQSLSADDPLNRRIDTPPVTLPPKVIAALARMPTPNPYDVPISILRNGHAGSDARARRLRELTE